MAHEHEISSAQWDDLRSRWNDYTAAVGEWMGVATAEGSSHEEIDDRIHSVIAAHNSWSEAFTQIIQATHHH